MQNGATFKENPNYNIGITPGTFVKVMDTAANLFDTEPCVDRIYSALIPARPKNRVQEEEVPNLQTPEILIPSVKVSYCYTYVSGACLPGLVSPSKCISRSISNSNLLSMNAQ